MGPSVCWLCWQHIPRRFLWICFPASFLSFASKWRSHQDQTALVLHYPGSHIICKCVICVAPSSPYLCCSFITLLGEMSGEMLLCSPEGLELPRILMVHLGVFTLYPVLTRAFSCISSLKATLDYSLFPPWRAGDNFALDVVVCVQMFEQLMLALLALPPPPTASYAWGSWEIPHTLCLQKLISGAVTFNMHKQH